MMGRGTGETVSDVVSEGRLMALIVYTLPDIVTSGRLTTCTPPTAFRNGKFGGKPPGLLPDGEEVATVFMVETEGRIEVTGVDSPSFFSVDFARDCNLTVGLLMTLVSVKACSCG